MQPLPTHAALRTFLNHGVGDFYTTTYPRHNLVKTEEGFRIEIAIPGWDKKDIEVSFLGNKLEVRGWRKQELPDGEEFVERGLSGKPFRKLFELGKNVVVDDVYMARGLLNIDLAHEVPEEERPKKFEIN